VFASPRVTLSTESTSLHGKREKERERGREGERERKGERLSKPAAALENDQLAYPGARRRVLH